MRDGTGTHDTIVNQLLTKIDGVDALNNILLIGMTNRCAHNPRVGSLYALQSTNPPQLSSPSGQPRVQSHTCSKPARCRQARGRTGQLQDQAGQEPGPCPLGSASNNGGGGRRPWNGCDCRNHTVLHHSRVSRGRVHELGRSVQMHALSPVNRCCLLLTCSVQCRKDMLDEAMLRPGRLEVQIEIGLPDEKGRLQILKIHTSRVRGALDNKQLARARERKAADTSSSPAPCMQCADPNWPARMAVLSLCRTATHTTLQHPTVCTCCPYVRR